MHHPRRTFKGTLWGNSSYHGKTQPLIESHRGFVLPQHTLGPPTDEVMAAWKRVAHIPLLNVTTEEMSRMGHSLDSVQYPPERGGVSV